MVCHGYSCTSKSAAGFDGQEWKDITAVFKVRPVKDAATERARIGKAIAMMERISGKKTGTDEDLGAAGSIKESNKQLDCIDETVNTTMYLGFLRDAGLLKFHEPALPVHRGYFIDGRWPHNTAVIKETESGVMYVVDSFYRPNGEEPYIVLRDDWINGWKPAGATQ